MCSHLMPFFLSLDSFELSLFFYFFPEINHVFGKCELGIK